MDSANPWSKTRSEHAAEAFEDYAEAILALGGGGESYTCETAPHVKTQALANHFQVSQPTATKLLRRLHEGGFVCIHQRQFVHLTVEGAQLAERSLGRHRLIVQFLTSIGVSEAQAELDAEGIEHHVSQETLSCMKTCLSISADL